MACNSESASRGGERTDAASTPDATLNFFAGVSDASTADEPVVACMHEGSMTECALPPQFCADPLHVISYGSSQCLSGFCRWNVTSFNCSEDDGGVCFDPDASWIGGGADAAGWIPLPTGCAVPAPAVPDPPPVACGPEAGGPADVECPLPFSVCANDTTLAYYDNGTCVSGACTWQTHFRSCPNACARGACTYLGTK